MNPTPESSTEDRIECERQIIRPILDDIAKEVEIRLREAGLNVPVFLTVPRSGIAIASMATPANPSDDVWLKVAAIVIEIVSERLDGVRLTSQEIRCATASPATMSAVDLVVS